MHQSVAQKFWAKNRPNRRADLSGASEVYLRELVPIIGNRDTWGSREPPSKSAGFHDMSQGDWLQPEPPDRH